MPVATENPSLILQKALDAWTTLPARERTASRAVLITAEACISSEKLTENATYTGSVKLTREVPSISQTVLELYYSMRARAGVPISESALEYALFPEYATNLSWVDGVIKVVTNKYTGMELLPGIEAIMPFGDDDTPYPSEILVDLMFNCLKLQLCTLNEIKDFVNQGVWKGARAYLLSDDKVRKLVAYGVHERFDADAVKDSILVARDCVKMIDAMFPNVQKITWAHVDETPTETIFEGEEYYACDDE